MRLESSVLYTADNYELLILFDDRHMADLFAHTKVLIKVKPCDRSDILFSHICLTVVCLSSDDDLSS